MPKYSAMGSLATFDSSSVSLPFQPGSTYPAVEWISRPRRPNDDLPSSRATRSSEARPIRASGPGRTRSGAARTARRRSRSGGPSGRPEAPGRRCTGSGCFGRRESFGRGAGLSRTAAGPSCRTARPARARQLARPRCRDPTARSFDRGSALALGIQVVHLALEGLEVVEALVYAGEADVGDLVERSKPVHSQAADLRRQDFARTARAQLCLDLVGGTLGGILRNGTTGQSLAEPRHELVAIELLPGAAALDDDQARRLDPFVSRESHAAFPAFPAPADAGLVEVTRIHDAGLAFTATGTAHRLGFLQPPGFVVPRGG